MRTMPDSDDEDDEILEDEEFDEDGESDADDEDFDPETDDDPETWQVVAECGRLSAERGKLSQLDFVG